MQLVPCFSVPDKRYTRCKVLDYPGHSGRIWIVLQSLYLICKWKISFYHRLYRQVNRDFPFSSALPRRFFPGFPATFSEFICRLFMFEGRAMRSFFAFPFDLTKWTVAKFSFLLPAKKLPETVVQFVSEIGTHLGWKRQKKHTKNMQLKGFYHQ